MEKNLEEINLIDLLKILLFKKKLILKTCIIFSVIGLFISITTEEEYTTTTSFISQSANSSSPAGSGISNLAALAGINLNNISSNSNVPVLLYPQILSSISFKKELLLSEIETSEVQNKVTLLQYYETIYRPGFLSNIEKYLKTIPKFLKSIPGKILRLFSKLKDKSTSTNNYNFESLSEKEKGILDILENNISINVDELTGLITVSATMPNAIAAASLATNVKDNLQNTLIDLKIRKSKEKFDFIKKQYDNAKKDFEEIQYLYTTYEDSNINITSSRASARLENLSSDYNLVFNIFNQLSQELETQKIQIQEDTPVFTVIEPAFIPSERSKPVRINILLTWIFYGFAISILYIFSLEIVNKLKEKL